jgi:hypothetical protein
MNYPSPIFEKPVKTIPIEIFRLGPKNAIDNNKQKSDSNFGDLQKSKLPETTSAQMAEQLN